MAITLVLAGLGCGSLGRFRFVAPSVELTGVTVTGLGLSGGSLELAVDVFNPNSYSLRSTRLQADVALEGTPFGQAELVRPLDLPPQQHSAVAVPLSFTWSGVGAGARALLAKGSLNYGLGGRLFVDTPVGQRAVDLRTTGAVTVRDLVR